MQHELADMIILRYFNVQSKMGIYVKFVIILMIMLVKTKMCDKVSVA